MANPIQRLIQYVLRGKDELSPAANQSAEALDALRSKTAELSQTLDDAKGARGLITGLENTRRAIGITETSIQRAETTVQALRESLDKNPDSKGLETSLKVAERDASTLRRTLDSLNAKLADQEKAAKDAGVDTSKLADEEKRLAAEVSKAKGELDQNTKSVRDLEREQARAARTAGEHASRTSAVGEAMSRGVTKVLGFTAAYLGLEAALGLISRGLRTVASGIGSMLNTGDMFEGLQTRLTSLMGSVASGEQATEWITKFAKDTPLQLGDVTDAFALLKAYGLDPMDGSLQSLEDQSEKLGGGMERLEGIATAVGQAWAKQKLQTEEILQLVERGVPAWDLLAKVTGRSAGELQDLASAGRLGRDAIKALIEEMGRSSAGAAEANMRRLSGLISNLQDTATNFLNRIAKAGALDHVKQRLEALADTIDQMDKDGRLDALAESLSNAFVKGADKVEVFAKKLLDVDFNKLVDDSTAWFNSFEEKINFVSTWATRLTAPFRLASNLVTGVMKTGLGTFSAFVGASLALIGGVARAIPDAFGGKKIVEGLEAARDTAFRITAEMGSGIAQDARDIRDTWNSVTGQVEQSVDAQVRAVERGTKAAKQATLGMTADVLDHFISTITGFDNAMAAVKFADTSKQLDKLKVAITEAFQAGRLTLAEFEQSLNAATTRQQSLNAATQQAAGASDEQARAVEQLKQKQAELLQQYLKHEITLEEYQKQHNAVAEQLRDTGKAADLAKVSIGSLQQAQDAVSSAKSVAELKTLQKAMFDAYKGGSLTLEEYEQAHNAAALSIRKLESAAGGAATKVTGLGASLATLQDVQRAISDAKTDVDISNIRSALTKLYNEGTLSAQDLTREQDRLAAKTKELRQASSQGAQGMEQLAASSDKATKSLADQRKEIGVSMEETRRSVGRTEEDMTGFANFFGGVISSARTPLAELSAEALAAFDQLKGISGASPQIDTSSLESSTEALQRMRKELAEVDAASTMPGVSSLGRWALSMKADSDRVAVSFLEQKQQLLSLLDGYEAGEIKVSDFLAQAKAARNGMNLLNDSDLRQLESTIESAKQRMQQLSEGSRDTLASLQEELAGLRGEQEAVDRSKFASRQRDLQQQLADAQAGGDLNAVQNLMAALGTLQQIEAEINSQRQLAEQKARVDAQAQQEAAKAESAAPAPVAASEPPMKIVRLETSRGPVDVGVRDDGTGLLSVLQDAGYRTT